MKEYAGREGPPQVVGRVLDGITVAKGLQRLEEVLVRDIAAELRSLKEGSDAPPAAAA